MICPNCNGKVKVDDVVNMPHDPVVYRRRKCPHCHYMFYTEETVTELPKEVADNWHRYRSKKFEKEYLL
jgi:transcriptional regulator NrdR family protein